MWGTIEFVWKAPVYWATPGVLMISPTLIMVSPGVRMVSPRCTHGIHRCTGHPVYSWYPHCTYHISRCTHGIPHCTEHPQVYSWYPTWCTEHSRCTQLYLPMYCTDPRSGVVVSIRLRKRILEPCDSSEFRLIVERLITSENKNLAEIDSDSQPKRFSCHCYTDLRAVS